MKRMIRVALVAAMTAVATAPAHAAETADVVERADTEIYVVNNHLADVRVFVEDAEGRLHNLGRIARGELRTVDVPEEIAATEYRIKVFPATTAGSPIPDDFGVKTSPVDEDRDQRVTLWLEADLTQSVVEIDRG